MNYLEIYRNNKLAKTVLRGETSRLGEFFRSQGLPLSKTILQRQCRPFSEEIGGGFLNKTKAVIARLSQMGKRSKANLILDDFRALIFPDMAAWLFDKWTAKVFQLIGEFQAVLVVGDRMAIDRKRYELAEILTGRLA